MIKLISLSVSLITFLIFTGCSASTGSRYEKKEEAKIENKKETDDRETEDFDITPYKTELEPEPGILTGDEIPSDVWYSYEEKPNDKLRNVVGTTDGYRVQVIATDDLEEANRIRSELYSKTTNKEVYVNFEPPFYKVKVGDFTSISDANDLKFMLNQLGYKEARVVQETVNLFQ